jgi:hypothetical protein
MAKERQIRENLRIERNKEIEIVISKLEEQAALQKEEGQATLDCRMKRLKDKYESQVPSCYKCNVGRNFSQPLVFAEGIKHTRE